MNRQVRHHTSMVVSMFKFMRPRSSNGQLRSMRRLRLAGRLGRGARVTQAEHAEEEEEKARWESVALEVLRKECKFLGYEDQYAAARLEPWTDSQRLGA
tara:strand:+ start:1303 stop:1599 length:297 start_codon:yes stop_codon:yes gene_type:complete